MVKIIYSQDMKLKKWKTKNTYENQRGEIFIRKIIGKKVKWYLYDFVDIPIVDTQTFNCLEEEYKRISEIPNNL